MADLDTPINKANLKGISVANIRIGYNVYDVNGKTVESGVFDLNPGALPTAIREKLEDAAKADLKRKYGV